MPKKQNNTQSISGAIVLELIRQAEAQAKKDMENKESVVRGEVK